MGLSFRQKRLEALAHTKMADKVKNLGEEDNCYGKSSEGTDCVFTYLLVARDNIPFSRMSSRTLYK